jgi:hypothetical protein
MNAPHNTACICAICAPESTPTRSPRMQSTAAAQRDIEARQLLAQFEQLDPLGRRVALATVATLVGLKAGAPC